MDELFAAMREWRDSKAVAINDGVCFDLASLAACESVSATSPYFIEGISQGMYCEGGVGSPPPFTAAERAAMAPYLEFKYPNWMQNHRDFGSHVQILEDSAHVFPGGDVAAFMRDYSRSLPPGWTESIVVSLRAGGSPAICRWTDERIHIETTKKWAERLPRPASGEPRFEALESYYFEDDDKRVTIPATQAAARVTLTELAAPSKTQAPTRVHKTGIEALDQVLATGGIPTGSRVVIQAATAQGKTSIMLEVAESLAAAGQCVVWVATSDETRDAIQARRRQRAGMSRAAALASTDESMLTPLLVVDGREHAIEEILACAGIDVLFVDPITKVRTANAVTDPVSRVGHVLDLVEASGLTCWMSAPVVRGAGRRTQTERAFGGARIEAGATLLLELTRSGSDLAIALVKSRLGGEGMEVRVKLDAERQRIVSPSAAAPAVALDDLIWTNVQAVLAGGPLTRRTIEGRVRRKHELVRAVVHERLSVGDLVTVDGKVSLP